MRTAHLKQAHTGDIDDGHYLSLAYHQPTKRWAYFDDEDYGFVEDKNQVSGLVTKVVVDEAYVLYYYLKDLKDFRRQTISHPEAWPFEVQALLTPTYPLKKNKIKSKDEIDSNNISRKSSRRFNSRVSSRLSQMSRSSFGFIT